jgi:hypothetical protein
VQQGDAQAEKTRLACWLYSPVCRPGVELDMAPRLLPRLGALLATLTLSLTLAAAQQEVAAAGDNDHVTEQAAITYQLLRSKHQVKVTAAFRITNLIPDTATVRYYTDDWGYLSVPAYVQGLRVTGTGVRLELAEKENHWRYYVVSFPRIFRGQSVAFQATWTLPSRGAGSTNPTRVTDAYSHFCWYGQPVDSGTVTAVLPHSSYQATSGSPTRTNKRARSSIVAARQGTDMIDFDACTDVYDEAHLIRERFTTPGGHDIVVEAWPEDRQWLTDLTAGIDRSLTRLEGIVGAPIPGKEPTMIREAAGNALGGYGGLFSTDPTGIRVSESWPDPETLAHELAHSWFNRDTLAAPWLSEGLAEWAGQAGVGGWCADPPAYPGKGSPNLGKWPVIDSRSTEAEQRILRYHYQAACAVMTHVADAVGPDRMREVLGVLLDGHSPYDRVSGTVGTAPSTTAPAAPSAAPDRVGGPGPATSALAATGVAPGPAWSPTRSGPRRTKPVDWRQWLDVVDEIGLAPAGNTDLGFAEQLIRSYGIVKQRDLRGRADARAAFHQLQTLAPNGITPAVLRRALDDWKFRDAQSLTVLAADVAARILGSSQRIAGDADALWARYESAVSARDLRRIRDRVEERQGLGADTVVLTDEFSDGTLWGTAEDNGDTIAYHAGTLAIDLDCPGCFWYSSRPLDRGWPTLTAAGSVTSDSTDGEAGWGCGNTQGAQVVGVVGPDGWELADVVSDRWTTLGSGALPAGVVLDPGGSLQVAIDCGPAAGGSRVMLTIDGVGVADIQSTVAGPWSSIVAMTHAGTTPIHAGFDDLVVLGGAG